VRTIITAPWQYARNRGYPRVRIGIDGYPIPDPLGNGDESAVLPTAWSPAPPVAFLMPIQSCSHVCAHMVNELVSPARGRERPDWRPRRRDRLAIAGKAWSAAGSHRTGETSPISAIAEAAKQFNITPARRFKIVVTKISEKD
jgi:hypothetical protein